MVTLTPDKALLERLRAANGPVEFRDEDGKLLGVYAPVNPPEASQVRRKVRTPVEEAALLADLERRAKDPGPDWTFSQAFEHLLSLT
jgi:hypothetical protein